VKPLSARDPFKIGVAAIAVLALLAVGVVFLSQANFGKKTYSAVLAQSAGLRAGEAVEVHGVISGKVKKVAIQGTAVKVDFTVSKDIDLGSDTTATVKVATLLGTHYLEVDPKGSGSLPGGTVPLAHTAVPYNLQDVLNEGSAKLEELDPVMLSKALAAAADVIGSSKDEIAPAISGVAALSNVIAKRNTQVAALLQAARSVSDQLTKSSPDIVELMKQATLVTQEITSRRDAIHTMLVETTKLSHSLTSVITKSRADLKPALASLDSAITSLNKQSDVLTSALDELAPASRYVANALGNGPWLDLNMHAPLIPTDEGLCALGDCS
jgi:phospholipid/cholesterol/gamma-HCH transport system substrate-binding protein